MRDATNSWSGYTYQSVIGLVVSLEEIYSAIHANELIRGTLAYEDAEDFSVYINDEMGNNISSKTYQVKFKKSQTPSDYYGVIRGLLEARNQNTGLEYFLAISENIDFDQVNFERNELPENFQDIFCLYRNGRRYLGGLESISYLSTLVMDISNHLGLGFTATKCETVTSLLISHVDRIILSIKDNRRLNEGYREEIQLNRLLEIITNTVDDASIERCGVILRKRIAESFYLYCEAFDDSESLEKTVTSLTSLTDDDLVDFIRKIEIHKDCSRLTDVMSALSSPEDIQEIFFDLIRLVNIEFDLLGAVLRKRSCVYRPSTLRLAQTPELAAVNLEKKYIPQIRRNMSLFDVEGYFETKKIIIKGNTVENIWDFMITTSHREKREHKINEPELKTLINITEAVEEINNDE